VLETQSGYRSLKFLQLCFPYLLLNGPINTRYALVADQGCDDSIISLLIQRNNLMSNNDDSLFQGQTGLPNEWKLEMNIMMRSMMMTAHFFKTLQMRCDEQIILMNCVGQGFMKA